MHLLLRFLSIFWIRFSANRLVSLIFFSKMALHGESLIRQSHSWLSFGNFPFLQFALFFLISPFVLLELGLLEDMLNGLLFDCGLRYSSVPFVFFFPFLSLLCRPWSSVIFFFLKKSFGLSVKWSSSRRFLESFWLIIDSFSWSIWVVEKNDDFDRSTCHWEKSSWLIIFPSSLGAGFNSNLCFLVRSTFSSSPLTDLSILPYLILIWLMSLEFIFTL